MLRTEDLEMGTSGVVRKRSKMEAEEFGVTGWGADGLDELLERFGERLADV